MQILIISGFLGAGKTTFIKRLVEMTNEKFVVLENEYGELPVDGDLLQEAQTQANKEIDIWELTEGCICCSVKADFTESILTIANAIEPKFLIVEPTGVGKLSNVMGSIRRIQYERIQLLKPITIIDANCFDSDMVQYREIYEDQMVNADRILLSKTEQMDDDIIQAIGQTIRTLSPEAVVETEHYSCKDASWWTALLQDESGRPVLLLNEGAQEHDLDQIGIEHVCMTSIGVLIKLLEDMVHGTFGAVRRAKGCVKIDQETIRFDVVDGRYSVTGASDEAAHNAVFIGRNLNTDLIEQRVKQALPKLFLPELLFIKKEKAALPLA